LFYIKDQLSFPAHRVVSWKLSVKKGGHENDSQKDYAIGDIFAVY